jgi:hypothetical protein
MKFHNKDPLSTAWRKKHVSIMRRGETWEQQNLKLVLRPSHIDGARNTQIRTNCFEKNGDKAWGSEFEAQSIGTGEKNGL